MYANIAKIAYICRLKIKTYGKKEHRKECRIYECPECKCWHLTSQEEYFLIEEIPINELIFCKRWQELSNKNL